MGDLQETSLRVYNEKSYSYSFWLDRENKIKFTTSSFENQLERPNQGKYKTKNSAKPVSLVDIFLNIFIFSRQTFCESYLDEPGGN